MQKRYPLAEIAQLINAQLEGDSECQIWGVASLEKATAGQVSFLGGARNQVVDTSHYKKFLATTQASAVILSDEHASACPRNKLITSDPYGSYIKLASLFDDQYLGTPGIHATAIVGDNCQIHPSASIGAYCVIGHNCHIGEHTYIGSNSVIQDSATIGKYGRVHPNVTIYHRVTIGDYVVIFSGAVIGKQGFGVAQTAEGWQKIPHLATVVIGDHVEVGANTTIDRGCLEDTVVGDNVKLDNQIQIAHGVIIGDNTLIAACVGIAGSTKIGKNCMIAGGVGIADNLTICDNVIFTAMSGVDKTVTEPGIYSSGSGIQPQKVWYKNVIRFYHLDKLARKVNKLEREHYE